MKRPLRILAFLEATNVTGPAKNLIRFAVKLRSASSPFPKGDITFATFLRKKEQTLSGNAFTRAVVEADLQLITMEERFRFDLRARKNMMAAILDNQPDIVQTHNVKSHLYMRSIRDRVPQPWLAYHHGYTTDSLRGRAYVQFDRWSLRGADRVVTGCRPFEAMLRTRGVKRERIRVIPNSIETLVRTDDVKTGTLRGELGLGKDAFVYLSAGRLSHEKGQIHLLRAWEMARTLLAAEPVDTLLLAGDGPDRRRLERFVADRQLGASVQFLGHRTDIRGLMCAADCLVLPSLSEGSPNVVLEAMALKLPVIASAVGGVPELITHNQTGVLVPPADASALYKAMLGIRSSPIERRRIALAAQTVAQQDFSPQRYFNALTDVYRELTPDHEWT